MSRQIVLVGHDRVRPLLNLNPATTHLVLSPSFWRLPHHYLLNAAVSVLLQRGATVEVL